MIKESEVQERLWGLSRGRLALKDFESWIADNSWNMHMDSSPEAVELVSTIHLLFSEFQHGDMSADDLRAELVSLAKPPSFVEIRVEVRPPATVMAFPPVRGIPAMIGRGRTRSERR